MRPASASNQAENGLSVFNGVLTLLNDRNGSRTVIGLGRQYSSE